MQHFANYKIIVFILNPIYFIKTIPRIFRQIAYAFAGIKKAAIASVVAATRSKRIPLLQTSGPSRSMICRLGGAGPNGCRGLCEWQATYGRGSVTGILSAILT